MDKEIKTSLLDDLTNPRADKDTISCKLMRIRSKMGEAEQEALDRALVAIKHDEGNGKSKTYSTAWLCGVLKKHGHTISTSSVQRHMNGGCGCE